MFRTGQAVLHSHQRRLIPLSSKLTFILSMTIFGTIGLFVRLIPLPSSIIALTRAVVGTVFLLVLLACKREKTDWQAIRRNIKILIISGAAIGFNWILLFEAYRYTTVAIATLCYYFSAIFVIVASPFVLREKLTPRKIACSFAALVGIILVSGVIDGGSGSFSLTGVLLGLGAAVLYASVIVLNKKLSGISSLDTTISQLGAAAAVLLPYVLLSEDIAQIAALDASGLLLLLAIGIVHTGIAYAMYFSSLQKIKAQTAALFSYLDPVIALLLSIFVLKEGMTVLGLIGAVIVLGAMLLSERDPKKS